MQTNYNNTPENPNIDLKQKNKEIQHLFLSSQKDFQKRKELREQRLKEINEYRDEQVAALNH
ncbi:MAG: hypothetical protein NC311_08805 [Muribaculaceae bacterium]|nr:hypothetical protein [Muribaculaceae bacterium]MCM1399936.1 hypothetical protein [Clostridium sp.]MCM1460738.1 hypothetical protein [Bacteroides sp.]